jgi:NAD(P)-dependent dehydrogenase (short-subunit alcohol dehydrogenase family)
LLKASGGAIVNIVGIGGHSRRRVRRRRIGQRCLAGFHQDHGGIRVNAINPGAIETDRLLSRIERYAEAHALALDEVRRRLLHDMGVARFGGADEIAAAVAFLASPRAAYVQGGLVDIDGRATRSL